jgi:hypothetical protein
MSRSLTWYARRLKQMSAQELAYRTADKVRAGAWARRQEPIGSSPVQPWPPGVQPFRVFPTALGAGVREAVPAEAAHRVIAAADRILAGDWVLLGTPRPDISDPDWFLDPVSGRHAPNEKYAFRIDHRDEAVTGNVKAVWEISRHQHLTVLASAWWLTRDDVYADAVASQLRSWWRANPFLSGVNWISGIELGVRLISWTWIRRMLDDWPKVTDLFDANPEAVRQIWWHQEHLAAFRSRGSSANNHVIAEAAGLFVAACAFPWYRESSEWRDSSRDLLRRELAANTFESGLNREMATEYHCFVTELALVAAAEGDASGHPLPPSTWALLTASMDAAAAILDSSGRAPRQGDADEGRGLVLDDPQLDPWDCLLAMGATTIASLPWWPMTTSTVSSVTVASLCQPHVPPGSRPITRPNSLPDAGMTLLRTPAGDGPEIWCRCDGGPHGFLSIAAHAHADALAVEVRYGGVDILADPGTYCYHGEPEWRSYFRSTIAHNTIEVGDSNQSVETGPFMWAAHARTCVDKVSSGSGEQTWSAHHTGYRRLDPGAEHKRTVTLDPASRHLSIVDEVEVADLQRLRMAFHLGPQVSVALEGTIATLSWLGADGTLSADLHLPAQLHWTAHRGQTDPILGWYSPQFGHRVPATTLLGTGVCSRALELRSLLVFPSA